MDAPGNILLFTSLACLVMVAPLILAGIVLLLSRRGRS